ncbi:hypothetical protein [Aneurinibacillus thermoaerophilus]|uniref:hypothetical protein n=1 Tax=Aneurinibacillus thermoaerophilus TaxID=143495 RepID=UPI002E2016B0|nr:hypothetical protein [Aneurinibacillus thermoaerophilus]
MDKFLDAVINLAHEAYPEQEKLVDYEEWLAGKFEPPCLFIQVQHVGEKANTLTSSMTVYDAGMVIHFPKSRQGVFQPVSLEPLTAILRRERFQYPTYVNEERILLNIDPDSYKIRLGDRKDRAEVTFRFEVTVKIPVPQVDKIEEFDIEMG